MFPSPLIAASSVHRTYTLGKKTVEVLRGIDLEITRGERVFLCGASGAGKTTLLYTLAGLERPEKGKVLIDGNDLYALSQKEQSLVRNSTMGYIFQNYYLLPELTALENVMVPGMIRSRNHRRRALDLMGEVGLGDRIHHLPAELSGGEQQRVALARAFVAEPNVLLADEPTGSLDGSTGDMVINLLFDLQKRRGTTLILVTHATELAAKCKRVLRLADGRVAEDNFSFENNF